MKPAAITRAEPILGCEATSWSPVVGRGYSIAERWRIECADGTTAFVKMATTDDIGRRLRDELRVYRALEAPFMPRFLGWGDGPPPLLVLEDLAPGAHWPPPWSEDDLAAVLRLVDELEATTPPSGLPSIEEHGFGGWAQIAEDPEPFLSLGLCTSAWLDGALPALLAAEAETPLAGDQLVHCDLRSDNLCIRGGRAVLFDWNFACVGNAAFDYAFWLPSLTLEGGPSPREMAARRPAADAFAALVTGFFGARAGLPPPVGAPTVRTFQRAQLEVALPWALDVLGLGPPG
jgi:hypothetical protein